MENKNFVNKDIFDAIKKKFFLAPSPEVHSDLWSKIESQLPPERKSRKPFIYIPIFLISLILVVGSILSAFNQNNSQENQFNISTDNEVSISEKENGNNQPVQVANKVSSEKTFTSGADNASQKVTSTLTESNSTKSKIISGTSSNESPNEPLNNYSAEKSINTQGETLGFQPNLVTSKIPTNVKELKSKKISKSALVSIEKIHTHSFIPTTNLEFGLLKQDLVPKFSDQSDQKDRKIKLNIAPAVFSLFNQIQPLLDDKVIINDLLNDKSTIVSQFGIELMGLASVGISDRFELLAGTGIRYSKQQLILDLKEQEKMSYSLVAVNDSQFELVPNYKSRIENIDKTFTRLITQVGLTTKIFMNNKFDHSVKTILDQSFDFKSKSWHRNLRFQYVIGNKENRGISWSPFLSIPLNNVEFEFFETKSYKAGLQLLF